MVYMLRDFDEFRENIKKNMYEIKNSLRSIDNGVHKSERKLTDTASERFANTQTDNDENNKT